MKDATSDRRVVTVLKADISGSTALGARLDPEDLRAVLGSYFTALARELRGGVRLAQSQLAEIGTVTRALEHGHDQQRRRGPGDGIGRVRESGHGGSLWDERTTAEV